MSIDFLGLVTFALFTILFMKDDFSPLSVPCSSTVSNFLGVTAGASGFTLLPPSLPMKDLDLFSVDCAAASFELRGYSLCVSLLAAALAAGNRMLLCRFKGEGSSVEFEGGAGALPLGLASAVFVVLLVVGVLVDVVRGGGVGGAGDVAPSSRNFEADDAVGDIKDRRGVLSFGLSEPAPIADNRFFSAETPTLGLEVVDVTRSD